MLPDGRQQTTVLPVHRLRAPVDDDAETGDLSTVSAGRLPARGGPRAARQREPEPDAGRQYHRAHALGRRLGCHHDRQEPCDDLFELLGYHIKANPKYGSEKKGQPTTYYLSAAPEPIRINCEYYYVDVVLSPDPNVFGHTNAVAGLNKGGVLVMQSDAGSPEEFWQSIPDRYRKTIIENEIRVFYLDAFKIARDEATDPELQLRMQGIAFQGAFFATSPLLEKHGLSETQLLEAIRDQLQHKFGSKGARVVEDNMRVVRRGFEEIYRGNRQDLGEASTKGNGQLPIPVMVKREPQSASASSDIHRFWAQTGSMYAPGQGESFPPIRS